ncbi:MAG: hypothetical protein C4326_03255 [Ignavibacteria bacterium]
MRLKFSAEDIERWRDRTYRRTARFAITNEKQALAFINSVGFCLASKADGLELPNLWEALVGRKNSHDARSDRSYYLSYAWDIHHILPNHNSVYYGKLFRRRPTLVSREYFPYFYALAKRTGAKDEYLTEFSQGNLSALAKHLMDILVRRSPLTTKELRTILATESKKHVDGLDRALDELQRNMYICRLVGSTQRFGAAWAPVLKMFGKEVRKARKISVEDARCKLLEKYFRNQLITSVETIHKVLGWSRKDIYHTLGQLIRNGIITPCTAFDGEKGKWYCIIRA